MKAAARNLFLLFLLVLLLMCMSSVCCQGEEVVNKKGFIISYGIDRQVSSKQIEVYDASYPNNRLVENRPVYSVNLTGKVSNDLFRNIAFVKLTFGVTKQGRTDDVVITVSSLGGHENKTFYMNLYQGETDLPVNAELKSFYYQYTDGTGEEVK